MVINGTDVLVKTPERPCYPGVVIYPAKQLLFELLLGRIRPDRDFAAVQSVFEI